MTAPAAAGQSGNDSAVPLADENPPLQVTSVSHRFGEFRALDAVSIDVAAGEVVSLLGPNGAGKTTLIRTIAGRLSPGAGTVRICGEDPAVHRKARGRIGLVPQNLALYDTLTARENLEIFGELFGLDSKTAKTRATELLELTGLTDKAGTQARRLSGGMRRRLNIAAAVMHEPAVLLLDEPSVGVDLHALEGVTSLILQLKEAGYAIVLTTHDMALSQAVSDRIIIMKKGAVIAEGSLNALKRRAFSGRQLVSVNFALPIIDEDAKRELAGFGLSERPDGSGWCGTAEAAGDTVARLTRLAHLPPATQMTVADPGLEEVYVALAGEPLPVVPAADADAEAQS